MVGRQRVTNWTVATAVLLSVLLVGVAGTAAQGAQPQCTTIASGLLNPKFVAVADDGTVYVTEAGTGGTEVLSSPPGAQGPPATRGTTGQVTAIAPDGTRRVAVDNLPSYGITGPAGLVAAGAMLWVAVGGPVPFGPPPPTQLPNENAVLRIDPRTGAVTNVADIGAYERANNPDTFLVASNLYGLALGADGLLYVADAGGNTLYRVDPRSGALGVVTVFPGIPVTRADIPEPRPLENPDRGGRAEIDPVPTGVAAGPDGTVYVGNLAGGLVAGKGQVVRVSTDGSAQVSPVVTGLFTVQDVTVGPDGLLYASQFYSALTPPAGPGQQPTTTPGNVLRVRDGRPEVAVPDLTNPAGMAFDRAGALYVVTNNTTPGPPGTPPDGRVLRCVGVAAPMPGLPNTGGGGGDGLLVLPFAVLALIAAAGGAGLVLVRRRVAQTSGPAATGPSAQGGERG